MEKVIRERCLGQHDIFRCNDCAFISAISRGVIGIGNTDEETIEIYRTMIREARRE
jgi:hypothetical protein